MKNRFLLILAALFFPLLAAAQPAPDTLWFRTYPAYLGYAGPVIRANDDGYLAIGRRINGDLFDLAITRTDGDGNVVWSRMVSGTPTVAWEPAVVCRTADNAYFVVGRKRYGLNADIMLMKVSDAGDSLWSRIYSFYTFQDAYGIAATADGGYVIVASVENDLDEWCGLQTMLMKINAEGDTLWTRHFQSPCDDAPCTITSVSDGGFLLTRHVWSEYATAFQLKVTRTDAEGNEEWSQIFEETRFGTPSGVIETADGFVMAEMQPSTEALGTWGLLKFDAQGNVLWFHDYPTARSEFLSGVVPEVDGGFVLGGHGLIPDDGRNVLVIMKADANGELVWRTTASSGTTDHANGLCASGDGGWVIAGGNDPTRTGAVVYPLLAKFGMASSSEVPSVPLPASVVLEPNYPNPFNPSTSIGFDLPRAMPVTVSVYNLIGEHVAVLLDGAQAAGHHQITFDGSDLPSGMYFYKLTAPGFSQTKKMMLMR